MAQENISTADIPEASAAAWRHARHPRPTTTALAVEELDGTMLKVLAASRMDARHDWLNALMDTNR